MRRRVRGINLVEVLVSLAISALVLSVCAVLYKNASVDFATGTANIAVSQAARQAVEKIAPYVSAALPPGVIQGDYIYSPVAKNCSQDDTVQPNIYCLDFSSCIDFLKPDIDSNPGSNFRGTGPSFRYRVRYDLAAGQLLLERLKPDQSNATLDNSVSPRILGKNLNRVTFIKVDRGINVRIAAQTTDKQGNLREGLTAPDGRTMDPDSEDRHLRARSIDLFTTVMIPFETAH